MILPVGVGLKSWSPTGAVGFTITTGKPAARELQRHLLGQELRALVGARHVLQRTPASSSSPSPPCGMPMQPTVLV